MKATSIRPVRCAIYTRVSTEHRRIFRWVHRSARPAGLLYDDAGHRKIPTHATKAGIRYRYYASLRFLCRSKPSCRHNCG